MSNLFFSRQPAHQVFFMGTLPRIVRQDVERSADTSCLGAVSREASRHKRAVRACMPRARGRQGLGAGSPRDLLPPAKIRHGQCRPVGDTAAISVGRPSGRPMGLRATNPRVHDTCRFPASRHSRPGRRGGSREAGLTAHPRAPDRASSGKEGPRGQAPERGPRRNLLATLGGWRPRR